MAGEDFPVVVVGQDNGDTVQLEVARTDAYFAWACLNGGRRIEYIQSRRKGEKLTHWLQVLIELPADDKKRRSQLRAMALPRKRSVQTGGNPGPTLSPQAKHEPCMRVNGAHKVQVGNDDWDWQPGRSAVTAIVKEEWLVSFLRGMQDIGVRWEMAHPRVAVSRRTTLSAPRKQAGVGIREENFDNDPKLRGKVMVIVDHGCPFAHPAFRRSSGMETRVRYLWLQDSAALRRTSHQPHLARPIKHGTKFKLFPYGWDLRGSQLDALMAQCSQNGTVDEDAVYERLGYDLMEESSSHGAHVMSIACGHPNPLQRRTGEARLFGNSADPASEAQERPHSIHQESPDFAGACDIIFVQLPQGTLEDTSGGGMQAYLIDALLYAFDRVEQDAEVVINCSFGTHAGPHDGSRLMDEALKNVLSQSGLKSPPTIVFPVGNSFNAACHAVGKVSNDTPWTVKVEVPPDKSTDTFIEWWIPIQYPLEDFDIGAKGPRDISLHLSGTSHCSLWRGLGLAGPPLVTLIRTPGATKSHHRIFAVIAPTSTYGGESDAAPYGHWTFALSLKSSNTQEVWVHARIERDDEFFLPQVDRQSRFVVAHQTDTDEPHQESWVSKEASNSPFANIDGVHAVGGLTRPTERDASILKPSNAALLAVYSAASPVDSIQFLAYVDDSSVLWGRLGLGHRERFWSRRNGTSVAAPQVARSLLNTLAAPVVSIVPNEFSWQGNRLSPDGEGLRDLRLGQQRGLPW